MPKKNQGQTARIIAVANHKGGVGKTTSSVNISACLVEEGYKTLLIDSDPQANTTTHLGIEEHTVENANIYHAITGQMALPLLEITPNFYLVPSHIDLVASELQLMAEINREKVLYELLSPIVADFDYIVIDCPPSIGLLTVNALSVAHDVVIPVLAETFGRNGLDKLTNLMLRLRTKGVNPILQLRGVFFTAHNPQLKLHQGIANQVRVIFEAYDNVVLNSFVRRNVSLSEAAEKGLDVLRYASESAGAEDYRALTAEILAKYN